MDNTNRFDGRGEIYAKARPKYASELFDYMKNKLNIQPGRIFADVGSGTGIFSGQLIDCGYMVYAIEPNDDMRIKAEEKLSVSRNFISIKGSDGNLNIPDGSVDYITVAQAFHWFDAQTFKNECKRVLRAGRKVFIIYNSRKTEADCTRALAQLRHEYNSEFAGFSNGMNDEKCIDFFNGKCEIFKSDNTLKYDRKGYINRVLSSSYSLKQSDDRYEEYLKDINGIFDMYSLNGIITIPNETIAYIGEV